MTKDIQRPNDAEAPTETPNFSISQFGGPRGIVKYPTRSCHSHGKAVLFIDGAYRLNDCLYDSAVLWRYGPSESHMGRFFANV